MRIAYIINQYPAVSHTFIRREIQGLETLGIEVMRISIRGWDLPLVDQGDLSERLQTKYVLKGGVTPLIYAAIRVALMNPSQTLGALKLAFQRWKNSDRNLFVHLIYIVEACQILLWTKAANVQHLHAHFCTNSTEVAMQCRQLGGPPYSFTAHGSDLMDKPTLMGLDIKTIRAKFAVAVCSYGRSQLFRWIPHSEWHKIKVIRCGLEPGNSGRIVNRLSGAKRLVCVGRLSKEKGQLLLIQAINLLNGNGQNFHLTIVGDGPMKQEIQSLCESYGLNALVEFTGWQSAAAVKQHMLQADAVVLPSLSEGLPIVIMEAMALKRVVIAPYLAGIPELVFHDETGWLFPAGDFVGLAHAIELLITTSNARLRQMEENAFVRVWQEHDGESSSRQLYELIHEDVKTFK